MSQQELRNALQTLRSELDNTSSLDAQTRQMLQQLDSDLHTRLSITDDDIDGFEDVIEQYESARRRFSVEHPRIQGVLDSIISMLSRMGI